MSEKTPDPAHSRRRLFAYSAIALALPVGAYLALAIRIANLTPTITTDPVARWHAGMPAWKPGSRAWDSYMNALAKANAPDGSTPIAQHIFAQRMLLPDELLAESEIPLDIARRGDSNEFIAHARTATRQSDSGWKLGEWWLAQHARNLDQLRAATAIPVLGFMPDFNFDRASSEFFGYDAVAIAATNAADPFARSAFTLRLPQLSLLRECAGARALDASHAAVAGDGSRAVDDFQAVLNISVHCAESRALVSHLIASAVRAMAWQEIMQLLRDTPASFRDDDLVRLRALVDDPRYDAPPLDFAGEREGFRDFVQRAYSQDGTDDGLLLSSARAQLLAQTTMLKSMQATTQSSSSGLADFLLGPIIAYTNDSRAQTLALHEQFLSRMERNAARPLWQQNGEADDALEQSYGSRDFSWRTSVVHMLMPALSHAAMRISKSALDRDAARFTIALEQFRRSNQREATSLQELIPTQLASVCIDPYSGVPYLESVVDGALRVWSVGHDGVDDDGVVIAGAESQRGFFAKGLWVPLHAFHTRTGQWPADNTQAQREMAAAATLAAIRPIYSLDAGVPRLTRDGSAPAPSEFVGDVMLIAPALPSSSAATSATNSTTEASSSSGGNP